MIQHNLISIKEVMARVSMSKSTIYRHISNDVFPAPVKVGKASYWVEAEIDEWINKFIEERNAA